VNEYAENNLDEDLLKWERKTINYSLFLFIGTLAVCIADTTLKIEYGNNFSLFGCLWLQAIIPFAHMTLIVALTRTNGGSIVDKVLRLPSSK